MDVNRDSAEQSLGWNLRHAMDIVRYQDVVLAARRSALQSVWQHTGARDVGHTDGELCWERM